MCYSSSETDEKQTRIHRDVYDFVGEQGWEKLGEIMLNSLILHEEVEGKSFFAEKEVSLSFKRVGGGYVFNSPSSLPKFRFKFVSIYWKEIQRSEKTVSQTNFPEDWNI